MSLVDKLLEDEKKKKTSPLVPEEEPTDELDLRKAIQEYKAFNPAETEEAKNRDEYLKGSYENRGAQESFIRDRMNSNDWAEVAQTLAGALTRFGAARSGLNKGIDLSGVNPGPGVDYSARNDRLLRELSGQAEQADRSEARTLGRLDSSIEGKRKSLEDAVRYSKLINDDARADRKELTAQQRAEALEESRNRALTQQERLRIEAEDRRDARQKEDLKQQDLSTRLKDLATEEKADAQQAELLQSQVSQLKAARNAYLNPNVDDPEKEKAIEKLKGLSPGEREALDKVKDKQPGFFGKLFGKNNSDAQAALEQLPLPQDLQDKLNQLAQRKQLRDQAKQELGFSKPASPLPENKVESSKGPAPAGKIRVRRKADGQTGSIVPEDFDPAKYEKL